MRIELREQLAEIEHQRWSDWQRYMHDQCEPGPDGTLIIPADKVERWSRQIETPYRALTEHGKDSDRQQVDRVWHIFEAIRNNYADEIQRVRESHQALARQVAEEVALKRELARRLEAADGALTRIAAWLHMNVVLDEGGARRIKDVEPDYVAERAVAVLDRAKEGLRAAWPHVLEKLEPMLMALLVEVAKDEQDQIPDVGRSRRADSGGPREGWSDPASTGRAGFFHPGGG